MAKIAHSCAGASATCGMLAVVPLLRQIEQAGNARDLESVGRLLAVARQEFARIQQFLAALPSSPSAKELKVSVL